MESIWTQTAQLPAFEPLRGDLKTGVLVIGGGMAGLLCAYRLTEAGADCALVEADRLCGGVTAGTTAKITSQHGLVYHKLLREFGPEKARLYLEANQAALEEYRRLCQDIDCGFQERDSAVFSLHDRRKIQQELEALACLGFTEFYPAKTPFPSAGAVGFRRQAQFHPLKFAAALAGKLRIFEHTKVLELAPGTAVTNGGTISAENIVVATHFPLLNKHGGYFLKLWKTPPCRRPCTWTRAGQACRSGPGGICCCWGAEATALESGAAAGGIWRPSPKSAFPRPGNAPAGPPRTA